MRAGWMRPSAMSRSIACSRDLAAVRIERRQDDRAGRVVDDEIDAGRELERADVAPLAADDAPLEIVARQVDDRHGRLDGVLGGAALDGFGDVVLRAVGGRLARFGVEALEEVGGVVPRVGLDLLEQELLGFLGRQARDALELVLLLGDQPLVLRGGGRRRALALGHRAVARVQLLFEPLDRRLPLGERGLAPAERLLEGRGLLALLTRLPLGLHQEFVRLLLGFEQRLLLPRLGLALGVAGDARRLLLGAADRFGGDPLAVGHPRGEHGRGRHHRDDEVGEISEVWQHA